MIFAIKFLACNQTLLVMPMDDGLLLKSSHLLKSFSIQITCTHYYSYL